MSIFKRGWRIVVLSLSFAMLLAEPARAQDNSEKEFDRVVVTATREARSLERLGSAATVITSAEIERTGVSRVLDLFSRVPGLYAFDTGGPGGTTSVRLRGADTDQTLVLIDGVRVNDAASAQGDFDFSSLLITDIERIEVVRGPQSAVWGSDAIGGVINIITRRGDGPLAGHVRGEVGSFDTRDVSAAIRGGNDTGDFSLSARFRDTDGFSRVAERLGATEDDGSTTWTVNGRASLRAGKRWTTELAFQASDVDAETDPSLAGAVDGDARSQREVISGRLTQRLVPEAWPETSHELTVSGQSTERDFFDATDAVPNSVFNGSNLALEYQTSFPIGLVDALAGARYQRDTGENFRFGPDQRTDLFDEDFDTRSAFVQGTIAPAETLDLTFSSRVDDFEIGDTRATWRASGSYRLPALGTRLRSSVGTGAKAPTIFQSFFEGPEPIFGSTLIGNPDLGVETSLGWDIGVEQRLFNDRLMFSAGYYEQRIDDLIQFEVDFATFTSTYVNIDRVRTEGFELEAQWNPLQWVGFSTNFTTTDAVDRINGLDLARTPDANGSLRLDLDPWNDFYIGVQATYVGDQFNRSRERDPLDDFVRVDLDARWQLLERLSLSVRIENVFDETYEVVRNAGVADRSGYLGLRLEF